MRAFEIPDEIGDPDPDQITKIVERHCTGFTREEIRKLVMGAIAEHDRKSPLDEFKVAA